MLAKGMTQQESNGHLQLLVAWVKGMLQQYKPGFGGEESGKLIKHLWHTFCLKGADACDKEKSLIEGKYKAAFDAINDAKSMIDTIGATVTTPTTKPEPTTKGK